MDILIDLYQQGRINAASNKAEAAKSAADHVRWELDGLKRKADALTITCQALWEIIRARGGLSDELLLAKMQEIDARDGRVCPVFRPRPEQQRFPQVLPLLRRNAPGRPRLRENVTRHEPGLNGCQSSFSRYIQPAGCAGDRFVCRY